MLSSTLWPHQRYHIIIAKWGKIYDQLRIDLANVCQPFNGHSIKYSLYRQNAVRTASRWFTHPTVACTVADWTNIAYICIASLRHRLRQYSFVFIFEGKNRAESKTLFCIAHNGNCVSSWAYIFAFYLYMSEYCMGIWHFARSQVRSSNSKWGRINQYDNNGNW